VKEDPALLLLPELTELGEIGGHRVVHERREVRDHPGELVAMPQHHAVPVEEAGDGSVPGAHEAPQHGVAERHLPRDAILEDQ
jgi:hypothetical protein